MIETLKKRLKKKKRYLHTNIEFLLEKNYMDVTSLSSATGIPMATIFRLKKENNNPTISSIEPIADFFRIELNNLLYDDLTSEEYQNKRKMGAVQYVPVINLEDIQKWPTDFNSKIYMGTIGNLHTDSFGISINTNSMSPIFFKNTVVVIDPSLTPKDSDYVFCIIEKDKVPVIRQIFFDGKTTFFKPINPNYGDMICVKNYKILGVIVKSIEQHR